MVKRSPSVTLRQINLLSSLSLFFLFARFVFQRPPPSTLLLDFCTRGVFEKYRPRGENIDQRIKMASGELPDVHVPTYSHFLLFRIIPEMWSLGADTAYLYTYIHHWQPLKAYTEYSAHDTKKEISGVSALNKPRSLRCFDRKQERKIKSTSTSR